MQETLIALHTKRHTWRDDTPILRWLLAIARYKLIDAFRPADDAWRSFLARSGEKPAETELRMKARARLADFR